MSWYDYISSQVFVSTYVYHRLVDAWNAEFGDKAAGPLPRVPLSVEGSALPITYGQVRVRSPVLIWSGNTTSVGSPAHYEVDMLFVVGLPFWDATTYPRPTSVELLNVYAGDISIGPTIVAPGAVAGTIAKAVNANLGGVGNGGGIYGSGEWGTVEFLNGPRPGPGTDTNARMLTSGVTQSLIPSYKYVFWTSLLFWSIGESPNITGYSFEILVQENLTSAYMGTGTFFSNGTNPMAALYDLLTGKFGKLGIDVALVDKTSFIAAAVVLFTEGHDYSRVFDAGVDATEAIGDILRQVDAMLYVEPTTGKITVKLVRNDYTFANLPDINPDNMDPPEAGWLSIGGWSETINKITVKFTDRSAGYIDGTEPASNNATSVSQGRLRAMDLAFPGIATRALANQVAARELAVRSRPNAIATCVVNRTLYAVRPGDVVTLTWPPLGIDHMVMRVAAADYGQLHDGRIRLQLIREVFGEKLGG